MKVFSCLRNSWLTNRHQYILGLGLIEQKPIKTGIRATKQIKGPKYWNCSDYKSYWKPYLPLVTIHQFAETKQLRTNTGMIQLEFHIWNSIKLKSQFHGFPAKQLLMVAATEKFDCWNKKLNICSSGLVK